MSGNTAAIWSMRPASLRKLSHPGSSNGRARTRWRPYRRWHRSRPAHPPAVARRRRSAAAPRHASHQARIARFAARPSRFRTRRDPARSFAVRRHIARGRTPDELLRRRAGIARYQVEPAPRKAATRPVLAAHRARPDLRPADQVRRQFGRRFERLRPPAAPPHRQAEPRVPARAAPQVGFAAPWPGRIPLVRRQAELGPALWQTEPLSRAVSASWAVPLSCCARPLASSDSPWAS